MIFGIIVIFKSMINHDYRLVFIHVPKCAGSSFNSAFKLSVHGGSGHAFYHDHIEYIQKGYFTCSIVRNPWDRLVSLYSYFYNMDKHHQWYGQNKKMAEYIKGITFVQFCQELKTLQSCPWSGIHFVPATTMFQYKNNINLDFVGKFETLDIDVPTISKLINVPVPAIPKLNTSIHQPYKSYYDTKTIDIVRTYYKKDIDLYQYDF